MKKIVIFTFALSLIFSASAFALKKPIIFPKNNQSREQQASDKRYCKLWAEDETGVDPSYIQAKLEMTDDNISSSAGEQKPRFGRRLIRGAAMGAAMGGLDDAIDNNVGKRAAQGAVLMGSRARQDKKQYYRDEQMNSHLKKKQQLQEQYDAYIRGFTVCMDAKGYSVK